MWPRNLDGSVKRIGDMTMAERKYCLDWVVARVKKEIEHPKVKAYLEKVIGV